MYNLAPENAVPYWWEHPETCTCETCHEDHRWQEVVEELSKDGFECCEDQLKEWEREGI